jgi:hypothetical protein
MPKTERKNLVSTQHSLLFVQVYMCASFVTVSGIHIWRSVLQTGKLVYGVQSFEANFASLNHLTQFNFCPFPMKKISLRGTYQSINQSISKSKRTLGI